VTGLYVIIDPHQCGFRDPVWVAEQALTSGCPVLQLRCKNLPDRDFLRLAQKLEVCCRKAGAQFWVNDRLDIALLSRADGLYLGDDDLAVDEVRQVWGPRLIGLTATTLPQARAAERQGVDLIGFGPVFSQDPRQPPDVGLIALAEVCRTVRTPVLAIGGIRVENARALRKTGARYAAAVREICGAKEPSTVARQFHQGLSAAPSLAP
jgi:thiamine-phosphate pyrophosphorylase